MERWKVKGWKKTVHPKESRGDYYIRQNKLKEKKVQWDKYCVMIKQSIYQTAVTTKNIYTSNIRYLRKMKQILNRHVQITRPKKSRKHMYLKDTENILYETPHVRPKLTILRDWYHKSIFPNNNKINKKKKKIPQMWTLNNSLLQHKWVQEKKSQGNF